MTTREDSEVDQSNENPVDTQGKNARIAAREVCVEESASDGIALKCKHCALCNDASHNGNQPNGVSSSGMESKSKCGHCCSVEAIPALPCSTDSSHDLNHSLEIHKANGEKAMQNGSGYLVQDEEISDVHNGIGVDHSPSPVYLTSPCSENVKPIVADVSSASFFSCPDDRLASPGSDSMVTACDGTSSRSCSSLSCPSSGSSASSLICALSPDRDSVAPTCSSPSANSFVEDQLLESLANQMSLTGNGMENSLLNSTLVSQHETPEALCLDSQPNISMPASSDVSSYSLDDSMVQDMNDLSLAASTVQLQSDCTQDCSAFDSLCDNVGVPSQWKELSASIRQLHQTVINSTVVEAGGSSCSVAVGAECSSGCRNSDSAAHPLPTVLCDSACHDCLTATSSECTPCSKSNGSLTREGQLEDSVSPSSTSGSTYTCKASSLAVEGELTSSSSDANAANSSTTPDEGSSSNGQSSDALLNSSGSTLVGDNSSDGTLDQLMAIKDGAAQVDASSASSAPPSGDGKFKTPNIIDLANLRTHTVKISSPVFQRPSIDRIKSLVEDLMVTDPHQLVLRLSQLLQEMCELLKVRLLAEVLSSPTVAQSHNFAKSVCQAYQQVVCVVDAVRPALHALETRFSLNWFSFALHVFNITILEDKDVTGYINVCKVKVLSCSNAATEDGAGGEGDVSGLVWWSWLARVCQEAGAAAREGHATRVTPHNRHKFRLKDAAVGELPLPTDGVVAPQPVQHPDGGSQSFACECEHCSSSKRTAVVTQPYSSPTAALSDAANNGLYPHIHGPSASSPKRPLFDNPYVGSDMLSEQLMKEWEQAYGDTIAPPGPAPFPQACVDSMHCCTPAANVTHVSEGSTPAAPVTSSCSPAAVTTTTAPHEAPPVKHDNNYCCDRHHTTSASSSAPPAARARTKAMTCKHEDDCTGESQSGTADEWSSGCNSSSGDESDASSSGHVDNHCDCCYYHGVHHKQSGGRQKYSDRRDRLLRILNEKKIAGQSVAKQPEESQPARQPQQPYVGDKDIDTILSYIDGSTAQKNNKKKQKQRVKKVASKSKNVAQARAADDMSDSNDCTTTVSGGRRAANSKSASSSKSNYSSSSGAMVKLPAKVEVRNTTHADQKQRVGPAGKAKAPLEATSSSDGWREDDMSEEEDEQERNKVVVQPAASLDELEDKDGAIAELRRRAPEVTVTLVKQDDQQMKHQVLQSRGRSTLTKSQEMQQQFQQLQQQQQPHQQRFNSGSSHPLHAAAAPPAFSAFAAPQPTPGGFGFPGLRPSIPGGISPFSSGEVATGGGGLSKLIQGLEKDDSNKDNKDSQMVTIRRVMDPASSEPTVTITLKGEQANQEKVLYKLVNGQAIAGNNSAGSAGYTAAATKEPLRPPPNLSQKELKKWKKTQKKERQRQQQNSARVAADREHDIHLQQYEQQREILKQQEEQLRLQTLQIQRQQEELLRLQQLHAARALQQQQPHHQQTLKQNNSAGKRKNANQSNVGKAGKKKGKENEQNVNRTGSGKSGDLDDLTDGLQLPPGVSISRVAGQPGMLNISSNPSFIGGMTPPMMGGLPSAAPVTGMYNMNSMAGMPHLNTGFSTGGNLGGSDLLLKSQSFDPWRYTDQTIVDGRGRKAIPGNKKPNEPPTKEESSKKPQKKKKQNEAREPSPPVANIPVKGKNKTKVQSKVVAEKNTSKKSDRPEPKNSKAPVAAEESFDSESEKDCILDKRMTADERIHAALNGLLDPERLSRSQRMKYNKQVIARGDGTPLLPTACKKKTNQNAQASKTKTVAVEDKNDVVVEEPATPVLRDSDDESGDDEDLMDQIYNLSVGKKVKNNLCVTGLSICYSRDDKAFEEVNSKSTADSAVAEALSHQPVAPETVIAKATATSNSKASKKASKKQSVVDPKKIKNEVKIPKAGTVEMTKPNSNAPIKTAEPKKAEKKDSKKPVDVGQSKSSTKSAPAQPVIPKTNSTAKNKTKDQIRSSATANGKVSSVEPVNVSKTKNYDEPLATANKSGPAKTSWVADRQPPKNVSSQKQQKLPAKSDQNEKSISVQNRHPGNQQKLSKQQVQMQGSDNHVAQASLLQTRQHHQPQPVQEQKMQPQQHHQQQPLPLQQTMQLNSGASRQSAGHSVPSAKNAVNSTAPLPQTQQFQPMPQQNLQAYGLPQSQPDPKNVNLLQQQQFPRHPTSVPQLPQLSQLQGLQANSHSRNVSQVQAPQHHQLPVTSHQQLMPALHSVFNDAVSQSSYNPLISSSAFSNPAGFGPFSNSSNTFGFSNGSAFGNSSAFPAVTNHGLGSLGNTAGYSSSGQSYLGSASMSGSMCAASSPNYCLSNGNGGCADTSGGGFSTSPLSFSSGCGDGHEARYAQYLAANANALSSYGSFGSGSLGGIGAGNGVGGFGAGGLGVIGGPVNSSLNSALVNRPYVSSVMDDSSRMYQPNPNAGVIGKKPKKGRKGLEDMSNLDSVFTPQDMLGDMDASDRDVEAFKRFCLYDVPRPDGEKPKINFNVKDILIKKKTEGDM